MDDRETIATVPMMSVARRGVIVGVFAAVGVAFIVVSPMQKKVVCRWDGDAVRCRGSVAYIDGSGGETVNKRLAAGEVAAAYKYRRWSKTGSNRRVTVCGLRRTTEAAEQHLFDAPCARNAQLAADLNRLASQRSGSEVSFTSGSLTTNIVGALSIFGFGLLFAVFAALRRRLHIRGSQLEIETVRLVPWLSTRRTIALDAITQVQLDSGGAPGRTRHNTWVKLADGRTHVLAAGGAETLAGQQDLLAGINAWRQRTGHPLPRSDQD